VYVGGSVRYEGKLYRPPSEADAYILQATIGCSWNKCTYCDMYRDKEFRVRPLSETLEDIALSAKRYGAGVSKVFVADGDALILPMDHWRAILTAARSGFPMLRRVSCYAMAKNVLAKTPAELAELRALGLTTLYMGPESGDDVVLKRIAKGQDYRAHVEAAALAHGAGMMLSVIALLGIGGDRSEAHARGTANLVTSMNPAFFSALTVTVIPGTPLATLQTRGKFQVPDVPDLLRELRTIVDCARPTRTTFRTNHASNYLALGGELPRDRERIVQMIDAALDGRIRLRDETDRAL
jgi:radical SAM superfamily enzyme YgiQ (UPF0313 family)